MKDLLAIYVSVSRTKVLATAAMVVIAIALIDWLTKPYISLGFLYLFPIMLAAGFLSRAQTVTVALLCAVLQEAFSNLPGNEAVVRLILSSAGFVGTGLFVAELVRNRRIVLRHVVELEDQVKLRQDAEEQVRILVESSPAAIVIIDDRGTILLANDAARQLLAPETLLLSHQSISNYLPCLQTAVETSPSRVIRTAMQCRGQRDNREAFLAGVWFSTFATASGLRLAAIVMDLSEDLRNREDLSLDHILKHARIVMSAMAHEIRNLSGAARVVHKNLSRVKDLERNEDFRALSTVIESLEKISTLEPRPFGTQSAAAVELTLVLDELRVLIDASFRESAIDIQWHLPECLPLVWADRYGLVQVFLNLARNSQYAMRSGMLKRLTVSAVEEHGTVVIRFEDTGEGISSPHSLFRPFHGGDSTGLGLYISRAVMRSFGGDLAYEPRVAGCCFAVILPRLSSDDQPMND
jgi:two-component system, LuxR family, sensor kinase FixL